MQDDTRAKELNAEATRALIGSTQETANVIATLDGALADTESALSRLNTELTNQEAVWIRYQTAVNEGHIKFQEWVKTSQDAATTQATFKADLEAMANTFGPTWLYGGNSTRISGFHRSQYTRWRGSR